MNVKGTRLLLALLALVLVGTLPVLAQDAMEFGDKLGPLPVDGNTRADISGTGTVSATLDGSTVVVDGTFEGLSSAATVAHLHFGAPGIAGPPVVEIDVDTETEGAVGGTYELNDEQREWLVNGELYVQIHTENNPGGELRAWLWPR